MFVLDAQHTTVDLSGTYCVGGPGQRPDEAEQALLIKSLALHSLIPSPSHAQFLSCRVCLTVATVADEHIHELQIDTGNTYVRPSVERSTVPSFTR